MITIGNIGKFESIPQILNDVLNENISALEEHLLNGWKLNKAIRVGKYTELSQCFLNSLQNCEPMAATLGNLYIPKV